MTTQPPPDTPETTSLAVLLGLAPMFYGLMAGLGLVWMYARGSFAEQLAPPEAEVLLRALGAGCLAAGVGVAGAMLAERVSPSMRLLRGRLRKLLQGLGLGTVLLLAVCSAVGEELFFRAAMQPSLGLWLTSAIFGLVHAFAPGDPPADEGAVGHPGLAWAGFAFLGGLVLGGLYQWSGSLWAPICSHFLLNSIQLWRLSRSA